MAGPWVPEDATLDASFQGGESGKPWSYALINTQRRRLTEVSGLFLLPFLHHL